MHLDYNNEDAYLEILQDKDTIHECFKMYRANRTRKYNNWNEICKWYYAIQYLDTHKNYKLIFGTLTFSDSTLARTSERTRTRYVTKYLSDHTYHYIANIDFGDKNNREHYHFIAMVKDKLECKDWNYGLSKFQWIKMTSKDIKSTKNYLLKLNNHSYKSSTRQKRIIRDRREDKIIDYFIENIATESYHRFKLLMNAYETS